MSIRRRDSGRFRAFFDFQCRPTHGARYGHFCWPPSSVEYLIGCIRKKGSLGKSEWRIQLWRLRDSGEVTQTAEKRDRS